MERENDEHIGQDRRGGTNTSDLSFVVTGKKLPLTVVGSILVFTVSLIVAVTISWTTLNNRMDTRTTVRKQEEILLQKEFTLIRNELKTLTKRLENCDVGCKTMNTRVRELEDATQRIWEKVRRN